MLLYHISRISFPPVLRLVLTVLFGKEKTKILLGVSHLNRKLVCGGVWKNLHQNKNSVILAFGIEGLSKISEFEKRVVTGWDSQFSSI